MENRKEAESSSELREQLDTKKYCGIEEFGRPRKFHRLEVVGSNPTPATN